MGEHERRRQHPTLCITVPLEASTWDCRRGHSVPGATLHPTQAYITRAPSSLAAWSDVFTTHARARRRPTCMRGRLLLEPRGEGVAAVPVDGYEEHDALRRPQAQTAGMRRHKVGLSAPPQVPNHPAFQLLPTCSQRLGKGRAGLRFSQPHEGTHLEDAGGRLPAAAGLGHLRSWGVAPTRV